MFYSRKGASALQRFVDKQIRAWKHEDIAYKAAFLGRMRNMINQYCQANRKFPNADEIDKMQDKLYDEVNLLDTDEHWEINKANTLEQLYNILNVLHKKCRNKELVINRRYEEISKITALVDPDKFPIFSLIDRLDDTDLVSIWEYKPELMKEVEKELGFSLQVKQSKIEHHEAGDGVFLKCANPEQKVPRGTMLGLVPGLIHSSFEPPSHENDYVERAFLTCYDDTYISYTAHLPYPLKFGYSWDEYIQMKDEQNELRSESNYQYEVTGDFFNPYALGHVINHPPPETGVNVALIDMPIPNAFFPDHLLKFLPYIKQSSEKATPLLKEYYHHNCYHGLAIIAVEDLEDGQELYCNYLDHSRYSMKFTPDWLIRPPPLSPYLAKYEYENDFSFFGKIIDSYLLSKQGDVYFEYMKRTSVEQSSQTLLKKKSVLQDRITAKQEKESKKQSA